MNIKNKIIQKMLFIVMWCFLISFTACTSDDSTTDTQQEQQEQQEQTQVEQEQQEQTQVEQPPQQTEAKKGMTEAEQQYFAQAKSDVEKLLKEIDEMAKTLSNASTLEQVKEAIPIAENCVTLGNKLKQLEFIEEIDTLSTLVTLFGWYAEEQGKTFIEALETNDAQKLEDWREICWPDMISYMYQLAAYTQEGKTIEEQLKQELIGILSEEEIKHVSVSDYVVVFQLEEESTEDGLKKIYEIAKLMCTQHKYDYLSEIRMGVDYSTKIDGKTFMFMLAEFNNSRKQIDFNTINWTDIPEVADYYWNFYDSQN